MEFQKRLGLQIKEALSPLNRYFTWQTLHKEPTDEECVIHYITKGGSEEFAKKEKQSNAS